MLVDEGLLKASDPEPMRKAVAFCQSIEISKNVTRMFEEHGSDYYNSLTEKERAELVSVTSKHIDGTMGAAMRNDKLSWLKNAPADSNECRILTNVRCLSEGVDVPSLDAVMFLSAKNSQIDVVQSVGRVMRVAPGKQYGYIIIPVVIPSGVDPEDALYARMVLKVGNKRYWEQWAADVAKIAQSYIEHINRLIEREGPHKAAFDDFLAGIRKTSILR